MTTQLNEFLADFKQRGFLYQATDLENLNQAMIKGKIAAYCGFDCTATSLHVGSLMQIMILRKLQQYGHKPIVLVGGGTTKIGDPTGKDEARKLLTDQDIATNMAGIQTVLEKFIRFGTGPSDAILLNNATWLEPINYIDFLREYGRHFSVNRMLSFDSVKLRLEREQNLSFLEFNYMLLQSYDFVYLNKHHQCKLQFGGSDQWGNIVSGIDLNKRMGGEEIFGITTPLITTVNGGKMGKTANGAVWLTAELFSAYDYFQFWRNSDDQDVGKFLRYFTELKEEEILGLEQLQAQDINRAKEILAFEATRLCHGDVAAEDARSTARNIFQNKEFTCGLPVVEIEVAKLEPSIPAFELLLLSGLVESGGEARRLIRGGGAKLNEQIITNELQPISISDADDGGRIRLALGKKKHMIFQVI